MFTGIEILGRGQGRGASSSTNLNVTPTHPDQLIHRVDTLGARRSHSYHGSPYNNQDRHHPLAFPVVDWTNYRDPLAGSPNAPVEHCPGMVKLPTAFQPKEVEIPHLAQDSFYRAQKRWEISRQMLTHCAHLMECKQHGSLPAWVYGINPVPGFMPHDSPLWDPLIELFLRQADEILQCVIDIMYNQARQAHAQFVAELCSLENLIGDDVTLQAQARLKLSHYTNSFQRRRLQEAKKKVNDGPALADVIVELRRRMISASYHGPLDNPRQTSARPPQPAQSRPTATATVATASGNVSTAAQGAIPKQPTNPNRSRGNNRPRPNKRPAPASTSRDQAQRERPEVTHQGPLDRASITTRELKLIAQMRILDQE